MSDRPDLFDDPVREAVLNEAEIVLARIDDDAYPEFEYTLRALDKVIEPYARLIVDIYREIAE